MHTVLLGILLVLLLAQLALLLFQYFFTTCEFYWGNTTFAEAFEHTGKHVCIHVSASRASSGSAQRLLLNHISTPHVTLASAVAASCALPGVMKPRKLQAKNSLGKIEDFEVDGVEWIDGSVQADIPFQRISTLFNVSNYIVCQTNFHVLPFLNKEDHPHSKSTYWKLFQTIEWDIRNRVLKLSRLGLFPTFFGQDISTLLSALTFQRILWNTNSRHPFLLLLRVHCRQSFQTEVSRR